MNWKDTVEIIGIAAVIAGLFLVFEELRQAGTIARVELSAETSRLIEALNEQERDPGYAALLAKSRNNPEELTPAERIQLNSYLTSAVTLFIRGRYYYNQGIFATWREFPRILGPRYFGTGYGRVFWEISKQRYPHEITAEVDKALMDSEAVSFFKNLDSEIVDALQEN